MQLSDKQWSIVRLIAEGRPNREIGLATGYTEQHIKNVICDIYDELGFSTRLEVALWFVKRQHDKEL